LVAAIIAFVCEMILCKINRTKQQQKEAQSTTNDDIQQSDDSIIETQLMEATDSAESTNIQQQQNEMNEEIIELCFQRHASDTKVEDQSGLRNIYENEGRPKPDRESDNDDFDLESTEVGEGQSTTITIVAEVHRQDEE